METHGPTKRIYYDGSCKVCSTAADSFAEKGVYKHFDVTAGQLPEGVTYDDAMMYMHVQDADGTLYKGADAVLSVMDDHWFFKFLAPIGRLPGLHFLARVLYRLVATHRYLLGRKKKTHSSA